MNWAGSPVVEGGSFVLWVVIALVILYRYPGRSKARTFVWLGTASIWIGYNAPDTFALVGVPEVIGATLVLFGLLVGLACYGYGAYIYTQS